MQYYINESGDRYPELIYNKLSNEKKALFKEFSDKEYNEILEKAESLNSTVIVKNNKIVYVSKANLITEREKMIDEKRALQNYLDDTDWISSKCYELDLKVKEEYPLEYEKRKIARNRINELRAILKIE